MAYTMVLGEDYLLNTVNSTILNQKVQVAGIITYAEAMSSGYDVRILAINEKVIGAADIADNNYLGTQQYYKCYKLDPTTNLPYTNADSNIIIVWSDIIDATRTNVLDSTYNYTTSINIPVNGSTNYPISTILADITSYVKGKYNATTSFTVISGDTNNQIDVLTQRLNDCSAVLKAFQGFTTMIPTLQKLTGTDISSSIDDINTSLSTIQGQLTTIAAGLS